MNNAEYLKRYLSKDDGKTKKKKKVKRPKSMIIDDDIDFSKIKPAEQEEEEDDEAVLVRECLVEENKSTLNFTKNNWINCGDTDDVKIEASDFEAHNGLTNVKQEPADDNVETVLIKQEPLSPRCQEQDEGISLCQNSRKHSPPKKNKNRQRHDSDSDTSPPRKNTRYDSDVSPPRKNPSRHDSDISPLRKSDSDPSPPRKSNGRDPDLSLPRRSRRYNSDESPPRKSSAKDRRSRKSKVGSSPDISPPRRDKLSSKSRAKKEPIHVKHEPDSDISPPRKNDEDPSPPRRRHRFDSNSSTEGKAPEAGKGKAKEPEATMVFRDKYGRKRDIEKEKRDKEELDAHKEAIKAKYDVWSRGVKQREMRQEMAEDFDREACKPLARYANDDDLNEHLKNKEKEGDPMLEYIRKKKAKEAGKSGKARPVYTGPEPPPNRFGIRPGYRWDGVDRSNGFEKQLFNTQNERKATRDIAYKWSTEDM